MIGTKSGGEETGGTCMYSYTDWKASWRHVKTMGGFEARMENVRLRRDNKSEVKRSDNREEHLTRPAFSGQGHILDATWE